MQVSTSRLERTVVQFRRRALWGTGLAACLGMLAAGLLDPLKTIEGAIALGLSASVLSSLFVAAIALERNEFADQLLGLGIEQVFKDRLQDIPTEIWAKLLGGVHQHFFVLGMANHGYLTSDAAKKETREALTKALKREKVTVEFMWLDPTSETAIVREEEEGSRGLRRDICEAIMFFAEFASTLEDEKQRKRLSLREYKALPTCGITWADNQLIVTHYLSAGLNLRAPGVVLDASQPLYRRTAAKLGGQAVEPPALARAYINNYREVASDEWSWLITDERLGAIRGLYESLRDQPDKSSEAVLRTQPPPQETG